MSGHPPGSPSRRPDPTFADILRAVLALAVGVLVVGWLAGLFRTESVVERPSVDYVAVAAQARDNAAFELAVPPALPAGWRATSARWEAATSRWHVGILTDDNQYVGIEQSPAGGSALLQEHAEGAVPAGRVKVDGQPWRRLVDEQTGAVTLVHAGSRATTLVTGTVAEGTLVAVAETLGARADTPRRRGGPG